MKRIAKRIAISAGVYCIVLFGVAGALVVFGSVHSARVFASILPGLGHTDMITKPEAIRAVVASFHAE